MSYDLIVEAITQDLKVKLARPKVAGRNQLPRKRARGIIINEEVAASQATVSKLPPKRGKGKGKGPVLPTHAEVSSISEGIYTMYLTSSNSEGYSLDSSPTSVSEPEKDQLVRVRREELYSKSIHGPATVPIPPTPPPPPAQIVEHDPPPAQVLPPLSLNRVKAEGLRTILELKQLSIDEVVERYLEVWNTIKFHKFEIFNKPRGSYIPTWVQEFYYAYGELVLKGKKKSS
uniref:Uncharacterized protein n=1 Tax=Solanum tuberosum TaxID=4113 RepID=M1DLW3_SOLTU